MGCAPAWNACRLSYIDAGLDATIVETFWKDAKREEKQVEADLDVEWIAQVQPDRETVNQGCRELVGEGAVTGLVDAPYRIRYWTSIWFP